MATSTQSRFDRDEADLRVAREIGRHALARRWRGLSAIGAQHVKLDTIVRGMQE